MTDLPAPTVANNAPILDAQVAGLQLTHDTLDPFDGLWWSRRGLEKLAQFLSFFFIVWRIPRDVGRFALKEIWHKDSELVFIVSMSEYVGALKSLWKEAEDVVNDQNALLGGRRSGCVWLLYVSFA